MIYINMLFTKRDFLFPMQEKFLGGISAENKKKIRFNLMSAESWTSIHEFIHNLRNRGIKADFVHIPGGSYMDKIRWACSQPSRYSVKMDDDTFISSRGWDYWIENMETLERDDVYTLSPLMSTGIPTTDWYCEQLFDKEEVERMRMYFKSIRFPPDIHGAEYGLLNRATVDADRWDADYYYEKVKQIPHYYKGIHPMRMHRDAQLALNVFTIKHFDRFTACANPSVVVSDRIYLCPQLNSIRTDVWKKIVERRDLYRDDWDEVPLNLYGEENNLRHAFMHGVFGVHMIYNWVGDERDERNLAPLYMEKACTI